MMEDQNNLTSQQKNVYTHDEAHLMAQQYLTEVGGVRIQLLKSDNPNEPDNYVVYDNLGRIKKWFFCQ